MLGMCLIHNVNILNILVARAVQYDDIYRMDEIKSLSFHIMFYRLYRGVAKYIVSGVVPKSDSLPEVDSPRVNAHDVTLCRQLRKQTGIRRRK